MQVDSLTWSVLLDGTSSVLIMGAVGVVVMVDLSCNVMLSAHTYVLWASDVGLSLTCDRDKMCGPE